MAPPQRITLGPLAAANAALIAGSQTPVSGTALTLTGTQPDMARRILLTYGNEAAPRTLVVRGTNHTGNILSETLAVPSGGGGTVATQHDYLTVISLTPAGGGWTAAVTVGTNGVASSPWRMVDFALSGSTMGIDINITGTLNVDAQVTYDDPNNIIGNSNVPPIPIGAPGLIGITGTLSGNIPTNVFAWRITINSGSGSLQASAIQTGMWG